MLGLMCIMFYCGHISIFNNPLDEAVKKFMVNGNNEDYLKIGADINK